MLRSNSYSHMQVASLMIFISALVAATTLIAKALGTDTLGPPLHALQVSAGRYIFALIALLAVASASRPKIHAPNLTLHVIRSALGWAGVSFMFAAAARMPLSDATAISFLNPVFAMIFAYAFLKERVGPIRWLAALGCFVGALILLRPGTSAFQPAAFLALAAALLLGMELIFVKRLSGSEPPFQILLVNNSIGVVLSCIAASFVWVGPTPTQWGLLVAIGVIMVSAQSLFIQCMRNADTSFAAPFFYTTLVFAAAYDLILFDVWPNAVSILGTVIIVGAAVVLALRGGGPQAVTTSNEAKFTAT